MSGPWEDFQSNDGPWNDFAAPKTAAPVADPSLLEPMTWYEKMAAQLPSSLGLANVRGSAVGRLAQGAADPGVALAQIAANVVSPMLPQQQTLSGLITGKPSTLADRVNQNISQHEQQYQSDRNAAGSSGFDPLRMAGNTGIAMLALPAGAAAETTAGMVAKGAAQGAGFGALEPVTNSGDSFLKQKLAQMGIGAATGGVMAPLVGAVGRAISPNASVNPNLKALQAEGVQPSVGQTLGGWANAAEEKLQSVPILGDAITSMRKRALAQFNEAAINRATGPIDTKISGAGQDAVASAGNALSSEYNSLLGSIKGVSFDTPQFNQNLSQLQQMSESLVPAMKTKFDRTLKDIVLDRMSPNGSMLGETLKSVDSELGKIAARYGKSSAASEQELGDAIKQLQANILDQVKSANPEFAARLNAADTGWANLVRVEGAAKAAKNNGGIFTPAQLNGAIQGADSSVRGRAVGRGTALMQDLGNAGQAVLGNKYPDSGTAGRWMMGAGGLAAGAVNPAIPAALVGGAAIYTPMVQNALAAMLSKRPNAAPAIANYLRKMTPAITAATVPAMLQQGQQ